ncbi:MAG: MATE family efflux transporter [Porphyromonadaceae bacterium]|nr:MATE family efflux transporter [Porphyromonadaceae bacterium]
MASIKYLTQGNLGSHLYKLALPIMGTSFVQMAYSFTDMAWLGRLSSQAVAAVGCISVFIWIATSVAFFNKVGSEVTISQSIGAGRLGEARLYASLNATMSLVVGCSVAVLFALFAPQLVDLYLLSGVVRAEALEYFYISLWGLPAVFLTSALFGIYNASGNSDVPFRSLLLGGVCNILLDPLFIHIFGWGVSGAAWATLMSELLSLGYFLYRLRWVDRLFDEFPLLIRPLWPQLGRIVQVGAPVATLNVLFALISVYMGRLASSVGGHIGVAALTTGGQLEALTWNTSQGITTALCSIVGQNYAARLYDRVWATLRIALINTLVIGLVGTLIFVFGGRELFALIVPDPVVYEVGANYLRISGYSQIFMMIEITIQGLFYGVGRSYLPASISIIGNTLRIPLTIWLVTLGFGLDAVWWAISVTTILKGLAAILALLFLRRKL